MPYGTYDCMGFGAVRSWTHIAKTIFDLTNGNGDKAIPVSIAEYYSGAKGPAVPRPAHSALDMRKLASTGFDMFGWEVELADYISELKSEITEV